MRKLLLFCLVFLSAFAYGQGGQAIDIRYGSSLPVGALENQIFIIDDGSGAIYVCVHSPNCSIPAHWISATTGQAPNPSLVIAPSSLSFGEGTISSPTQSQPIAISNNGNIPVLISAISFGGSNFSEAAPNACVGPLKVGATCVDLIQFTASAAVPVNDILTVISNIPVDPQNSLTVNLAGTGTATSVFPITLSCSGLGNGQVIDGATLDCSCRAGVSSGACQQSYVAGNVTFTATADSISMFGGFTGAGLSTSPGTFAVSQSQTVFADFDITPVTFIAAVSCAGQGTGTVTSSVGGINATCASGVLTGTGNSTPILQGTAVTFTEAPSGSCTGGACTFNSWSGINGCTTASTCNTTINANTTVSASFALSQTSAPLQLIQIISGGTPGTNNITGNFASAQQIGDTNIITLQWNDATTTVSGLTDTKGNTYTQVPTCSPKAGNGFTTAVYYASNIVAAAAGSNTVTVNLSASPSYRAILAAEYSGLTASPFDVCNSATGAGSTVNAGNITTSTANDLLVSTSVVGGSLNTASSDWTQRIKYLGNDYEDRQGVAIGTYNNSVVQTGAGFSTIGVGFLTTGINPSPTFSFSVLCGGNGSGTVAASGINITCSNGSLTGVSSAVVAPNSTVTLVAVPLSGSAFTTYNGAGCAISPSCTSSAITTNTTVTATFSLAGGQQNYFVNIATGNDTHSGLCAVAGTPTGCTGPWQHISKAISSFTLGASGAVIHVADGAYANTTINRGGGSSVQRLVLQCDSGTSAAAAQGRCTISGAGLAAFTLGTGANNLDIKGFDIGNNGNMQTAIVGLPCGTSGPSTCLNSIHIIGNYIHDLNANVAVDGNGCNIVGAGPAAILIPNKHFVTVTDEQIIGNIVLRFGPLNYPITCQQSNYAFYVDTPDAQIYNNLIFGRGAFGIQNYGDPCRSRIANNTIIGYQYAMTVSGGGEGNCTPGVVTISNNIMVGQTKGEFIGISSLPCTDGAHQSLFANNISDGLHPDFNSFGTNLSCNTTTPGTGSPGAFIHASGASLFINYQSDGTGNYQLKNGSPAVDTGTTRCIAGGATPCVPSFDILNVTRPRRTTFDVGAYELP